MSKKVNVLIVDDEEEFAITLAERLNLRGYNTRVENDGEGALNAVNTSLPDVVVLDVKMPGIDGFEVLKRIKSEYPQVPVILLTGHGATKDGIKGMELGAYDYLIKPVDITELIEKMDSAIEASKRK